MPGPRPQRRPLVSPSALLAAVALAALAARLGLVALLGDHPLLRPAGGLDGGAYLDLARRVAAGDLLLRGVPAPFFVSPLYVYFAAAVFAATGASVRAVLLVQALLGSAACWLAGDAARRLYGSRAAAPAAALLGLTGVVAFHEAIFLQAALDPFLAALALALLVRALEAEPRGRKFLAAGLALGLFGLNRPNVLPWAAVAVLLLLVARGLGAGRRPALAFAGGVLLAVAPAAARNLVVSGEPVLVSSHGGLNLLVGNGPGAEGVYRWLDGITPSIAGQAADAKKVAEAAEGRELSSREVSAHFARAAWAWAGSRPADAARLLARKLWYVFSGDEAALNFSFPWYRDATLPLRLLFVGPWLLVPLGGAGLFLLFAPPAGALLRRRDAAVWASFVPSWALLVAVFFVATRYRLPLYVALATAGGGALVLLAGAVRARRFRLLGAAGAVALPLAVLAAWPTGLDDGSTEEETQWVLHLVDQGEAGEVARRTEALAARHPFPGTVWFRVGQAWASSGRLDAAVSALERSLALDPGQRETEKVLSAVHERRGVERTLSGGAAGGAADFEAAVRLDAGSASAHLNLAAVLAERGETDRARDEARRALELRPGYEKAAALLRALGPGK